MVIRDPLSCGKDAEWCIQPNELTDDVPPRICLVAVCQQYALRLVVTLQLQKLVCDSRMPCYVQHGVKRNIKMAGKFSEFTHSHFALLQVDTEVSQHRRPTTQRIRPAFSFKHVE